tara:strand:- start:3546 stop:4655 length:1110 start_codon:yes stop_codon:yes gene_type:complete
MNILFIAPRMHSNQADLIKKLIKEGHNIKFLVLGIGASEDHSVLEPEIISLYKFNIKYLKSKSIDISKYPLYAIPNFYKFIKLVESFNPDRIILRGGMRPIYSIFLLYRILFLSKSICFYTQRPIFLKEISFKKKCIDFVFLNLLKVKWYTPVLYKGEYSSSFIENKKLKFLPFFKNYNGNDITVSEELNFLCVAKYEARKNIDLLLDCFEKVYEKNKNFHLTIIGTTSTTKRESYYAKLLSDLSQKKYSKKITLLKNIPYEMMGGYYKGNDVFVLLSEREEASISQLEAMSYNLAIICSNDNGSAHYVKNNFNGFVIKPNKKQVLNYIYLYLNNKSMLKEHKINSGIMMKSDFNIDKIYDDFYSFIIS